ncbi:MAG: glycosyl hydrolase [Bacteroidetes bacterium]|nr:glycosyl hydrolase [Bacteroidota bacterium]MBS1930262.1 glycosyl hydrolase [Bacteroidota bacterium]
MLSKLVQFPLMLLACLLTLPVASQVAPTSAEDRLKGLKQREVLENKSVLNDIKFRSIGPSIMSGRVDDLDVNPDDPTEFYIAYATGGLWYTHNNGQSFIPVFDSADVIGIGDIAVNWKTRTIWLGTGEVNSSRSSYSGIGIYKSSDNGKHWDYLGLPESQHIGKILLSPTDNNTAWVAVLGHLYSPNKERGVYKTTDGGKSWKQTLYIDDKTGCVDMDINSSNPNELYAAMWYRTRSAWNFTESGKTSGIYKSNDGGETWKLVSGPGSGFMAGDKIGRIGLAVFPKNPQIVYAIVDNNMLKPAKEKKNDSSYKKEDFKNITKELFQQLDDKKLNSFLRQNRLPRKYTAESVKQLVAMDKVKPTALWDYLDTDDGFTSTGIYGCEVYRSVDGGMNWRKVNEKDINIYSTYGYYFGKIYVSPVNDNKVIITGISLQMSTDGGKSFKDIDQRNVHSDHHAIWIDPNKDSHIVNGNDGGCNITYDDGEHWFFANTPAVGQYYSVVTDDDKPYNVYGGLQDNNVWYGPSTNRDNIGWQSTGDYPFKSLIGGDGMQVQVDTRDNTTTYAGSQFGAYVRLNRKTRSDRKSVRPNYELGEKPLRFNWQTPIMLSKLNQDIFYIGADRLYRSLNKGDSLVAISSDLTNGKREGNLPFGTITTIAESPTRFGLLYVGTDDGNVQVSKDNGYSWELISKPEDVPIKSQKVKKSKHGFTSDDSRLTTHGLWVTRIIASQYKESRVYVTLNGYRNDNFTPLLYVSDDYGAIWKQLGKDLPMEPLNVVHEDPKTDSILYVGSDGGLYVSFDLGNSFMKWDGGLPKSIPVHDIAFQTRENEIIIGTHGRSIYIAKLGDVQKLREDPDWLKKKPKEKPQETNRRFFEDDNNEMMPEKE